MLDVYKRQPPLLFGRSAADGLLVTLVGAGIHSVGGKDDCQNDQEYDGRQRVDLRADLFAGHGVDGNGQGLHGAAVEVGDHEVINGVSQDVYKRQVTIFPVRDISRPGRALWIPLCGS